MRAGQGRGLESVVLSARRRAASLLESVASGRVTFEQALGLWPDGRGDDADVEAARRSLRRRADARELIAAARALRAEPRPVAPARRRRATGPAGALVALFGDGTAALGRNGLAITAAAGLLLVLISAVWLVTR